MNNFIIKRRNNMKIVNGGVTAPKGYMASGIYAGIKKQKKE